MNQKFNPFLLSALLLGIFAISLFATPKADSQSDNPIFIGHNEVFHFDKLTAAHINQATEKTISETKESLSKLYTIDKHNRTFENTMVPLDDALDAFGTTYGFIYLMGSTHLDDAIRDSANSSVALMDKFSNELNLNEDLYKAVKDYSLTKGGQSLTGYKKKFVTETVRDFERNGFALSKEKRDELKGIQDKISELSLNFRQNIAEYSDSLVVDDEGIDGLDEDYKNNHKNADGKYSIDLSYPSYRPFMRSSKSENARKALYLKYTNRASDKNLDVLKNILIERQKMVDLLGYKTFAAYQVEDRMAKKPENVWGFENELIAKVQEKAKQEYEEQLVAKRMHLNDPNVDKINSWEVSFYRDIVLKEKYSLDQEKVKEYFSLDNVINGYFQVTKKLMGLEYRRIENPSVWHEDVRAYDVLKEGQLAGRFYLDLHPRANKYGHAACFPIISGKAREEGFQFPVASLVCNFPAPTESKPALLTHGDVETFFHEFGHVLHHLVSQAELSSQAGFTVANDFVEAPSQMLENWAWNYDVLKQFAKHYETGETLPKDLFDRMLAAKNANSGNNTLAQIYFGLIDMTLHDKYDPKSDVTTTEIVKELQNRVTLYDFVEGSNFHAAFGHLTGYAAGYYGYLWSQVYAADMFSKFEENGILDAETGHRYRDLVLARGSKIDELEMVKEFLGREPNQDAFLKSLGL